MNWFILALISSITLSLRELSFKRSGTRLSAAYMSWGIYLFTFILFLGLSFLLRNIYFPTPSFYLVVIGAALMDTAATLLYLSAIRQGDLSKTIPMLCFIPVVQLFVTPVLVQENLSWPGIAGVLTVVAGSYILNITQWSGILSPIRSIAKDRSSLMMLGTALLWGISSSFHKMGIRQTDALFWGTWEIGLIALILFPFAKASETNWLTFQKLKKTLWPSIFSVLTILSYYMAINLGPVAYVSSFRRLGVLFSMLAGVLILGEKTGRTAMAGGIIMIAGAAVICLYG